MDAFTLILGLTLAVVGIFLYRTYASFLRGAYAKHARVISIQQVFSSNIDLQAKIPNFVKNGFYPVIEYRDGSEAVSFTSIEQRDTGSFHVGDEIKLRILKTRRSKNRVCKTVIILVSMLFLMGFDLFVSAFISDAIISLGQMCLASIIIAVSLLTLVLYLKDQDELKQSGSTSTKGGRAQLCLAEPTAFKNWTSALTDPAQRYKIRSTQFFGATCMCSSLVVLAVAIQPLANFF